MHQGWRVILSRAGAVAVFISLGIAGLGVGFAAAGETPNDTQYTNPGSTEPTTTPTPTEPTTTPTEPTDTLTDAADVIAGAQSGGEPPKAAVAGEELPFTGLNLIVLIGLGGGLTLAGLALRRAGRSEE